MDRHVLTGELYGKIPSFYNLSVMHIMINALQKLSKIETGRLVP